MRKGSEPWDRWDKRLAPSVALLDAFQGKRREGGRVVARDLESIGWSAFVRRFRTEMKEAAAREALDELRAEEGDMTLLCYCEDESRCHRTLVKQLLEE